MMLIGKTANWLLRHSVQRCVKSRRLVCAHTRNLITRSVKVALKCLIVVVFVGYLCTSGVNLDIAVRFADPDFLLECKISAIISVDYCIFYTECPPYFNFRFL